MFLLQDITIKQRCVHLYIQPNTSILMKISRISILLLSLFAVACSKNTIPEKATAVSPFEIDKYLGTWYEIARIDFFFEKGLNNTTATYSLKDNGLIQVDNKGYDYKKDKWKQSIGKAKFVGAKDVAKLQVSFFGPFYSGYNVIALDDNTYALVAGESLDYLWILSREKTIPEDIKTSYLNLAKEIGYDTSRLLWVEQDKIK